MNIGELWWNRMTNADRFLADVTDALVSGKSVVMNFPDEVPWQDIMIDTLIQKLETFSDSRTFDTHKVSKNTDCGEYLFNKYCPPSEQAKYWPSQTYAEFLASNEDITLNHRYVFLHGITSYNSDSWIKTISEYLSCCKNETEHGVFIIMTEKANVKTSENIECFQYVNYVTDYDCLMLCLTTISSENYSSLKKQYISEVASNMADNNTELAGLLVSHGENLIKNPIGIAKEILPNCIDEKLIMAVWLAQVKILFPKLEQFRKYIIQKYKNKLRKFLPITNSNNERIDKVSELELGQIFSICCNQPKIMDSDDFKMLKKMRNARNVLAHWETVTYADLVNMKIL